jgi:hypothetical protein
MIVPEVCLAIIEALKENIQVCILNIFNNYIDYYNNYYFERFKIVNNSGNYNCSCEDMPQTVKHLLFDCPVLQNSRYSLILHLDFRKKLFSIIIKIIITKTRKKKKTFYMRSSILMDCCFGLFPSIGCK